MSSSEHAAERSVVVGARVPAGPSMTRWGGGPWEQDVQFLRLAHRQRQQQQQLTSFCPLATPLCPLWLGLLFANH